MNNMVLQINSPFLKLEDKETRGKFKRETVEKRQERKELLVWMLVSGWRSRSTYSLRRFCTYSNSQLKWYQHKGVYWVNIYMMAAY